MKAAGVCGIHAIRLIAGAPLASSRVGAEQFCKRITLRQTERARRNEPMADRVSFGEVVARQSNKCMELTGLKRHTLCKEEEQRVCRFSPAAHA